MNDRNSSPHERMLAYLREGDQLVPPDTRGPGDWEVLYDRLSEAADLTARSAPEPVDPPMRIRRENGFTTGTARSAAG
ncbi:hypothetical protein ACFQ2B_26410 [Streptomyces stramineus]|uniref:Uncharacterized protein n=1 Tax=Streptomyces stramineus TaxID=173861 RepID=A0ABP3KJ22_9ACTN